MIEFEKHIDFYGNYWWAGFSKNVPEPLWGDKDIAKTYLENYWLPDNEYKLKWKPIQDKIFINQIEGLPEMVFSEQFSLIAIRGGCLFQKEDFEQLQRAFLDVGDKFFVVIQNKQDFTEGEPMFRMKFPTDITWEELMNGNYISSVIFEMYYNEYFVFGESGVWGKYAASEYENPVDIIGFKPELSPIFKNRFYLSQEECQEMIDWLPAAYKNKVRC